MSKSCRTYWNGLSSENEGLWTEIEGSDGKISFLTLSIDEKSGDYTRLTKFKPGADTKIFGGKSHNYPEEVYIVQGNLFDFAFNRLLVAGDYASRPPGEIHGPFKTEVGCLVLEVSFPSQSVSQ